MSIYKPKIEDHDVELGLGFEKHGEERREEERDCENKRRTKEKNR